MSAEFSPNSNFDMALKALSKLAQFKSFSAFYINAKSIQFSNFSKFLPITFLKLSSISK